MGDDDSIKDDNVTDKTERDSDGVLVTVIRCGEGGSVETTDDDTTTRDVGVITVP
jgi:hypothetical protein